MPNLNDVELEINTRLRTSLNPLWTLLLLPFPVGLKVEAFGCHKTQGCLPVHHEPKIENWVWMNNFTTVYKHVWELRARKQ
ncbi:hypothetical protein TNCT_716271 [Trichonephila clavata]|uniref:Uncharacterized protein n=1 Tax=Trichonephila clavata TaxID=2740835 RepID=A0A8X6G1R3_TRICU|nr:hypothetical protein TNCT_716271 [Trichonephila clavata]